MPTDEDRAAAKTALMRSIEFLPDRERKLAYFAGRKALIRADLWPWPTRRPVAARLLDGLDRVNGPTPPHAPELGPCWVWTGALTAEGYGSISVRGRHVYVHRAALEIALERPLGEGMLACHRCENRACARPSHLYEGTYTENNLDVWEVRKRPRPGPVLADA